MGTKDDLINDIRAHTAMRPDGAIPNDLYYEFRLCIGDLWKLCVDHKDDPEVEAFWRVVFLGQEYVPLDWWDEPESPRPGSFEEEVTS